MTAGKVKIKIKNETSDIIAAIAGNLGVPVKDIQNEFHFFWHDMSSMMTMCLGYGIYLPNFGHLLLNVRNVDKLVKTYEKQINIKFRMIEVLMEKEKEGRDCSKKIEGISQWIADFICRLILLDCSVKQYEKEVRVQYQKKFQPKALYLEEYLIRLGKRLSIPISQFPIQIGHPLQEIYVRSLQRKGLLPNPVVYKDLPGKTSTGKIPDKNKEV